MKQAILDREKKGNKDIIANRVQRQKFWTKMMNDPEARLSDRLKASELLGRSEADFTERREIEVDQRFKELEDQADQIIDGILGNT